MVMQLPEDDKLSMSKIEMTSRLAIMMGGRVAEELKFGHDNVTAGAASDIQQATRLARAMVTRWGFADDIGPVDYGSDQGDVFLGQQLMQSSHISEDTSRKIEEEVRKLIQTGMDEARRIMTETRSDWEAIANGLLEYETLSGSEIAELLKGNKPSRPDLGDDDAGPASAVPVIGKRRKPKGDTGLGDPEPSPA
jgi:cell division protease FtsH